MNGKRAKGLRRIAESVTIRRSKEQTRQAYKAYKVKFFNRRLLCVSLSYKEVT